MFNILKEAVVGSFSSVKQMAFIIIPLMIIMEFFKDLGFLDKSANFFSPIVEIFDMKSESGFPLIIGIITGISYGAGFIIQATKEYDLSERDRYLIGIFLVCAHAIFEDTVLFMAVGVNGTLLITIRLLIATLLTFIASKIIKSEKNIKKLHLMKEGEN